MGKANVKKVLFTFTIRIDFKKSNFRTKFLNSFLCLVKKKQFQNEVLKFFFCAWEKYGYPNFHAFHTPFYTISGQNEPVQFDLSNGERGSRSNF